jgi:uncharacterized protein
MALLDPFGRYLNLPPALVRHVEVTRRIAVRMRDGTILRTDHYAPDATRAPQAPTVLVRTPYGRGVPTNWLARAIARRGFHVVVQAVRGTDESGGTFEPMAHERTDGTDTLDWLDRQPWHAGRVFTFGPSYVGFTQWAIADDPRVAALAAVVTASSFARPTFAGGSFSLDTILTWAALLAAQRGPRLEAAREMLRGQPRLRRALAHLPLTEADTVAIGREVAFFQRWLVEPDTAAEYWTSRGNDQRLSDVTADVLLMGGWYDIFLPWQLDDYRALRAAGRDPYLTIGPWTHGSAELFKHSASESLDWYRHQRDMREKPVRLYIGGADTWCEYDEFPPPGATPRRWFLQPGGGLGEAEPDAEELAEFVYDPADPTPALGGPRLMARVSGRRDNTEHETRADVRTFTTAPLTEAVQVVGPVTASMVVRASRPFHDVFVRLCDVDEQGRSWNLCDGLTRVSTADGGAVRVELWPTAHRFLPGHRIRVQVSGGAHPRFARNPGTGADLGAPSDLVAVRQTIMAPSNIELCPSPIE